MRMNKVLKSEIKRMAAVVLSAVIAGTLAFSCPLSVYAATKPEDMDEATWERLQDNTIEFDEIENLVVSFNPTYKQVVDSVNVNVEPIQIAIDELQEYVDDLRSEARRFKDDEDDPYTYEVNMATAKTVSDSVLKSLKKSLNMVNGSTRTTFNELRRTLTNALQQIMIGYNQLESSLELMDKSVELAQAAYDSTVTQESVGMATSASVQSAAASLKSAQDQRQAMVDSMNTLKSTLCTMTGKDYTTDIVVGSIPAPDISRISTMNPSADLEMAISYNPDIISTRATTGRGDVNRSVKFNSLDEIEDKLRTKLESLYNEVLTAQTEYQAAQTAFSSAQLTYDATQRQYSLGMLGKLEYLQLQLSYLSTKMTYDMAVLSLEQAILAYDWALYGVVDLD